MESCFDDIIIMKNDILFPNRFMSESYNDLDPILECVRSK